MISAEEYFKKEHSEVRIKRAIELNDLQSIYTLMEEFADNTMQAKNNYLLHDVINCDCKTDNYTKHESTNGIIIYKCKDCGGCL